MPKRISIKPHLSLEELENRYRKAKNAVERSHYQIIWLLAKGIVSEEVAKVTGYSRGWIYELVWGYNKIGPESLGDGRQKNPGAPSDLNDQNEAYLIQALEEGIAPDGGKWNGRKVADYLSELIGKPISRQQGWAYLKQMRWRLRVPRPSHVESNEIEQEEWKKKLHEAVKKVKRENPTAEVEIWCEDEHRLGLLPMIRRVWFGPNEPVEGKVNWKREWLWLYALVRPETGETYWWILPSVNTLLFQKVLDDFAQHFDIGQKKQVILAIDQAGWHMSKSLKAPTGIHLFPLPSHSPELQPAERLWPLVDEPLVNQAFENIQQIEQIVYERCRQLLRQTDLIRGLTLYHWFPRILPFF